MDARAAPTANPIPPATTPGAFLNFGGTNIYKSTQIEKIARAFTNGEVKSGDHILFTDAWHPGIINIKYMSELLGIKVITHGLWHAGSYDPADFLGRLIGDAPWVRDGRSGAQITLSFPSIKLEKVGHSKVEEVI